MVAWGSVCRHILIKMAKVADSAKLKIIGAKIISVVR